MWPSCLKCFLFLSYLFVTCWHFTRGECFRVCPPPFFPIYFFSFNRSPQWLISNSHQTAYHEMRSFYLRLSYAPMLLQSDCGRQKKTQQHVNATCSVHSSMGLLRLLPLVIGNTWGTLRSGSPNKLVSINCLFFYK